MLEDRANPTTFTVNSAGDGGDANLNDGRALDASGKTTFRAAIEQGNNLGGNITINFDSTVFPAGQYTTIVVQDNEYQLDANFSINGGADNTVILWPVYATPIGQPPQKFRIMEVTGNSTTTISYLTLIGANSQGAGGGVLNEGTLTVDHCSITGCTAVNGGGIANDATLTVTNSSISNNSAPNSDGGGIYVAPISGAVATITDSVISYNTASKGGGVAVLPTGRADLYDTWVGYNTGVNGGGVYTDGNFTMNSRSALNGNTGGEGGGVYVSGGTTTLTDTTVEANNSNDWGGGVWAKNGSYTLLTRCTFTSNTAAAGGDKIAYTGNDPTIVNVDSSCTGVSNADRDQITP